MLLSQHIYEFYYTYTYDDHDDVIQVTIGDSRHAICLSIQALRDAVCLPNLVNFSYPPSEKQYYDGYASVSLDQYEEGFLEVGFLGNYDGNYEKRGRIQKVSASGGQHVNNDIGTPRSDDENVGLHDV
ncbi:unnamed protein product [Lactuca virosa]|uniref:Uncharacterized protein n=1 Tax=Lactuca virosa TaxID=75947 RepID=A0AAU9N717_9ASTR|nr:unnamed protein product [Lactuca virosa]